MMEFRTASMEYIERMCEITEDAKRQLRGMGLDQWQKGYPSREVWLKDIQDGTFAGKWIAENNNGRTFFNRSRAMLAEHPMEIVGAELRKNMLWGDDVDPDTASN